MSDDLRHRINTRLALDRQMHAILADLECLSHGSTQSWNSAGGHDSETTAILPHGELDPPHIRYRTLYDEQYSDDGRRNVITSAETELKQFRGHGQAANNRPSETSDQFKERVLDKTEGDQPEDVERSSLRVSARTLRKWRREDGRNPETGHTNTEKLPPEQRRARVHELAEQGLNRKQIARRLGEHHMTIDRDLKKAA